MNAVFDAYAAYYDLLYRDKDYAGEAAWLHGLIRRHAPATRTLLELGCGTGAHAAHLARLGYAVHGLDLSAPMLERARTMAASLPEDVAGRLAFEQADIRDWPGPGTFDAVLSLFHVFSYQVTDADVRAAFRTVARHLRAGGILAFDFWHGPAVLAQQPERRVRRLEDAAIRVVRTAEPAFFPDQHRVDVHYDVRIEDRASGECTSVTETHRMRYFFPDELEAFAREAGLEPIGFSEWLADREPSTDSWSATMVARMP